VGNYQLGRVPARQWEIINSGESLPYSGIKKRAFIALFFVLGGKVI